MVSAGRDITVAGSQVVSDQGTTLTAGRDVNIVSTVNNQTEHTQSQTTKSGLLGGGGIGVTIGTRDLKQTTDHAGDTAAASTVASIGGDVSISAGRAYTQIGSSVQTPQGSIDVTAESIAVTEAREKASTTSTTEFHQSGLSVALSAPGIGSAMNAQAAAKMAEQVEDPRMKALAAATAAAQAIDAAKELGAAAQAASQGQNSGVSVSISIGSAQASSKQTQTSDVGAASNMSAGGNIKLNATGAAENSNITVRGSDLQAGGSIQLKADNQVNLLAAADSSEQHSKNQSSSASVGLSIGIGQGQTTGIFASASLARGNQDGSDQSQRNAHLSANDTVSIVSGGDTTLNGAVVSGKQVSGDIGGNLNIQSLQDTAKFDSKSQSASGTVAYQGASVSASVSLSQTKVSADYLSVGEQSGIKAGDNGFRLNVKSNTALDGGVISSSQKAVDQHRNTLTTGTLSSSDLQNHSQYEAQSISVTVGTSGGSAGAFKSSGNEQSTTKAGLSGADVTLTKGDTASQAALSKLDRSVTDQSTGSGIKRNWNGQKLAEQTQLSAQVVQAFGATASKEIGDYAASKTKPHDDATLYLALKDEQSSGRLTDPRLQKQLADLEASGMTRQSTQQTLNDPQVKADYDNWKEGGAYRVAAHAVVGGITGDASGLGAVQGSAGAGASQAAIPFIADQVLNSAVPDDLKKTLIGAAGAAVGAVVGGGAGAVSSFNATENNYLSHRQVGDMLAKLRAAKTQGERDQILAAYATLSKQQSAAISGCKTPECTQTAADIAAGQADLRANASELSDLSGWFNDGKQTIIETQSKDALKVDSQLAFNRAAPGRLNQFASMSLSAPVRQALEASAACIDLTCATQQYQQLKSLIAAAQGQDAVALTVQMDQLRGQANSLGGCIPNTGCDAVVGVANVAGGLVGMKTGPARDIPEIGNAAEGRQPAATVSPSGPYSPKPSLVIGDEDLANVYANQKQGSYSNALPTGRIVYNGVELEPSLPAPAAGWNYSPSIVKGAATDNQAWSHWTGFQAEINLANQVAGQGEAVLKWGGAVGTQGSDIISVNPKTGDVTLWDSKYRSNPANVGQSPTFPEKGPLNNAVNEAMETVLDSNLPQAAKDKALQNLQERTFTTNTVGAGNVKNSVQVRYCNGKPC